MGKIVLTSLSSEGQFVDWTTSDKLLSPKVKYIPLGLISLMSNISTSHSVTLIDAIADNLSIKELLEKIEEEKPEILGISAVTRKVYSLKVLLKKLKVPYVAVGGPHCTHYAQQVLEWGADAVFSGPLADLEFAEAITSKPKGIIICNSDINKIKFPDRSLINIDKYLFSGKILFQAQKRMAMFSSIGCPNRCRFCDVQTKRVRLKKASIVLDEMENMRELGCESVHVLDDNFNFYRDHLESILLEMEKRNWTTEWSGRGQVKMDFSLLPRMKDTGFKRIHVGFEAFDDVVLKFMNKPQKVKDIEIFCEQMNKHKIDMLGYIIVGNPVETAEYRYNLSSTVRNLNIKFPYFNLLFPEPNTTYYKSLLDDGVFKFDIWGEYMKNPTPDFEIPYPYGEEVKAEVFSFYNNLLEKV